MFCLVPHMYINYPFNALPIYPAQAGKSQLRPIPRFGWGSHPLALKMLVKIQE